MCSRNAKLQTFSAKHDFDCIMLLQVSSLKADAGEAPALRARLAELEPQAETAVAARSDLREACSRLAEMEGRADAAATERVVLLEQVRLHLTSVWCQSLSSFGFVSQFKGQLFCSVGPSQRSF